MIDQDTRLFSQVI
jgi:hypothetical protein